MGKNRSDKWGAWSEWTWHAEYGSYYRVRQNDRGELSYDYRDDTPRTPGNDGMKELTSDLHGTHLVESTEEYTHAPNPDPKGKGPATSYYSDRYPNEVNPLATHAAYSASQATSQFYSADHQQGFYGEVDDESETLVSGGHYAERYPPTSNYGPPLDEDDDGRDYGTVEDDFPTKSTLSMDQPLDPRYTVHHSSAFQPGKIFKIYWGEPKGRTKSSAISKEQVYQLGELIYQGFRRFIIIANDLGHCTCVPILTYENRACAKPGVKANKHGIIFDERKKAKTVSNEPPLGFNAVRAIMYEDTETLAKESRVNYSKPSTIEHNSLVWFIGEVHQDDFRTVTKAYAKCWEKKMNHGHQRDRRRHKN